MSRTRIYWTTDERDLVIEAIAEHIRKRPRARYAELWTAGNAILAPDRQRKWYSSYSGASNTDHVFFLEARRRANAQNTFSGFKEMEGPAKDLQARLAKVDAETDVTWVPVPTPQALDDIPLESLLANCFKRLLERYAAPRSYLSYEELQKLVPPLSNTPSYSAKEHQPEANKTLSQIRPVRIACCGLLPAQFNRVKERVNAKKVELVFVDKQYDPHQSDWKRGLDHVIVTRFVRHGHWDQAREALGNERVHWVSSGTDTVVAKVSELVPGSLN